MNRSGERRGGSRDTDPDGKSRVRADDVFLPSGFSQLQMVDSSGGDKNRRLHSVGDDSMKLTKIGWIITRRPRGFLKVSTCAWNVG